MNGSFPPAFKASDDGKPLLSWRVLILPYLEQNDLYNQFHLDEPWDSPHNKALIAKMPDVYRCSEIAADKTREGKTTYVTPRGEQTVFPGADAIGINNITDGTSNTIAVVDAPAKNMVVWTAPDDLDVSELVVDIHAAKKLKPEMILKQHGGGSYVGFADGSVRRLKGTINQAVFGALLTNSGGEVISRDSF